MARTYSRDSRGRFSGGGGGGGAKGRSKGPKLGKGRPGTSAVKGTVAKSSVDRTLGAVRGYGKGTKASPAKAAKAKPAKMSKAAPNKAKAAYKAATSAARQAKMAAGGRTSTKGLGKRKDAGAASIRGNVKAYKAAQAKVTKMEKSRGKYKPRAKR